MKKKTSPSWLITQLGFWYGFSMLIVITKGMGYQLLELLELFKNTNIGEMLVVGILFWILGCFFSWIFFYQYRLSKTYTEFYRRLINIFVFLTVVIFTSEIFDFYWNAVHQNSKLYSCLLSGLFFSPIFTCLSLVIQKIFLYLKRGHEISFPK